MTTLALKRATVALVGNPNAGKTSLFNALTGLHQKTGNYPGVTVEVAEGSFVSREHEIWLIDVPGLYSTSPISVDEGVAHAVLNRDSEESLNLIYVLDSSNLERNLFLYSQIVDLGKPLVVALTMTDVIERTGATIDVERLSQLLDCPVVKVIPHKGAGIDQLKEAIDHVILEHDVPETDLGFPAVVTEAADRLVERFSRQGVELKHREARCVILEEHCSTYQRFSEIAELKAAIDAERANLVGQSGATRTLDAQSRYAWASKVTRSVMDTERAKPRSRTEAIDRVLTHRVWGLGIFVAIMMGVFMSIYTFAAPLMDGISAVMEWVKGVVSAPLASTPLIQSMVVDGVLEGIGSVLVFLPQIIILFLWISILEGTGYLARAAFLMDRLLGWCGLNGRAFIPLLSSFACAVPGVMAARVMPDERSRLATVMVAPLMSCSARLPVYLLIIGTFVEPIFGWFGAAIALFAMHLVGLVVAIPVVFILNRGVLKGRRLPFMLELPRYQWPKPKDIALTIVSRVKVFMVTAGTIIFAMSILIWASITFPQADVPRFEKEYQGKPAEYQSRVEVDQFVAARQREESFLGKFGRTIEPVFVPAGFDWRITTAILAAFPAREVVVPAMGILFESGEENEDGLKEALQKATWPDGRKLITPATAVGLMVFFALCCQCMATLAAIRRETNSWKWPLAAFLYMTGLAYIAAVAIQVVARSFGQ